MGEKGTTTGVLMVDRESFGLRFLPENGSGPGVDNIFFLNLANIPLAAPVVFRVEDGSLTIRTQEVNEARHRRESVHRFLDMVYDDFPNLVNRKVRVIFNDGKILNFRVINRSAVTDTTLIVTSDLQPVREFLFEVERLYRRDPLVVIDPED